MTLTLFSFGYWGWGNATRELVAAIDAVEAARGFAPPVFVDVRLSRSVRAKGFDGASFEATVGNARYRWLDALGNLGIRDRKGMRLKDPAAADDLLDIALEAARERHRVLFYCACQVPGKCHRSLVAERVLEAAARRSIALEVVEWPGGEPGAKAIEIELPLPEFEKARCGAKAIALDEAIPLARAAAIPWYSLLAVRPPRERAPSWRLVTGPAIHRKSGWCLPVHGYFDGEPPEAMRAKVAQARAADGYEPRSAPKGPRLSNRSRAATSTTSAGRSRSRRRSWC